MKMGKTGIIMAGFLAFTLCFSVPVWAGDTADEPQEDSGSISLLGDDGLISRLFGEGGALSDIVPDTIDPGQVMQSVGDMLEDPDSMLNQTIDGVKEMVTGEDGSIDWTKLQEKAGDLIEFFSGGGGTEGSGKPSDQKVEELLRQFDNMDAAMKEYVFTYNSDLLESGDVQIFTKKRRIRMNSISIRSVCWPSFHRTIIRSKTIS